MRVTEIFGRREYNHWGWCRVVDDEQEGRTPRATPPYWFYLTFVAPYEAALQRLREAVCWWRGHDMVDGSYGGPEGGYESAECRRCGWGYHVRMY